MMRKIISTIFFVSAFLLTISIKAQIATFYDYFASGFSAGCVNNVIEPPGFTDWERIEVVRLYGGQVNFTSSANGYII